MCFLLLCKQCLQLFTLDTKSTISSRFCRQWEMVQLPFIPPSNDFALGMDIYWLQLRSAVKETWKHGGRANLCPFFPAGRCDARWNWWRRSVRLHSSIQHFSQSYMVLLTVPCFLGCSWFQMWQTHWCWPTLDWLVPGDDITLALLPITQHSKK